MKPASYTELVTAIADYTHRTDLTSGYVDYFITEAEAEMNTRLRTRRQLTAVTPTVSAAGVVTLPTGFAGWKRFQARDSTNAWDLDIVTLESQEDIDPAYGGTGVPQALINLGGTWQIWPYTDGTYTYRAYHFAIVPNLTSSATTNWVILNFPEAYLFGCLAAARGYVQDDPRFPIWEQRFQRAVERIIEQDQMDSDPRTSVVLKPNTAMFGGRGRSNIESGV